MRLLKLLKHRPPNFAGETIGMEFDDIANQLIISGGAVEVDEQGTIIATKETLAPTDETTDMAGGGNATGGGGNAEFKFDPRTDPFMTDGISKQASQALHAQGIHTVEAVRLFIAATPEGESVVDRINAIDGITDNQAEKIVKLYSMTTEHSE